MAVAVHNNNVSINTDNICTSPCLTGWLTTADAAAFGAEPIPASLEYRPLRIPCIMADPAKPAKMALKSNASLKICAMTDGSCPMFNTTINRDTRIYAIPINGTRVEVTFTILLPPPSKHHPITSARIPPMIQGVISAL